MNPRFYSLTKVAFVLFAAMTLFCNPVFSQEDSPFSSADLLASTLGIDVEATQAAIDELNADIGDLNAANLLLTDDIIANDLLITAKGAEILACAACTPEELAVLNADLAILEGITVTLTGQIATNDDEIAALGAGIASLQAPLTFLADLSPEQVFALNRSLNNAVKSGLVIDYTSVENLALLQRIIDEDLDTRQIHFLTKALEQEAKFLQIYARTGNAAFQDKAASARDKFVAKIDNTGSPSLEGEDLSEEAARQAAKDARTAAKEIAKEAREIAKEAAKDARDEAKQVASVSREEAKQAAKEARDLAKEAKKAGKSAEAHGNNQP